MRSTVCATRAGGSPGGRAFREGDDLCRLQYLSAVFLFSRLNRVQAVEKGPTLRRSLPPGLGAQPNAEGETHVSQLLREGRVEAEDPRLATRARDLEVKPPTVAVQAGAFFGSYRLG